jgi:hypothetical protein
MGTRINFLIKETDDPDARYCAMLFSNSHTEGMDAESVFRQFASECHGPTELVTRLLAVRYDADSGTGQAGRPVFTLDSVPCGSNRVLSVSWNCDSVTDTYRAVVKSIPGRVLDCWPNVSLPMH